MAAPPMTGALARQPGRDAKILCNMPRDQAQPDAIVMLAL